jgi:hypothetical protein
VDEAVEVFERVSSGALAKEDMLPAFVALMAPSAE